MGIRHCIRFLFFLLVCLLAVSCSRRVKVKGADAYFLLPNFHSCHIKRIAILPLDINLNKDCFMLYEARGLVMPSHEQITQIFFPGLFEILSDKGYVPISVSEMTQRLRANGLETTDAILRASPVHLSKILGVEGLFYTTVLDISTIDRMQFCARMVESRNGLTVWSDNFLKGEAKGKKYSTATIKGILMVGTYPATVVGPLAHQAASMVVDKTANTVYKLISSFEEEIREGLEDCLQKLPDAQRG